jgi:hypothetical protein
MVGTVCTTQEADAAALPLDRLVLPVDALPASGKAGTKARLPARWMRSRTSPIRAELHEAEGTKPAATSSNIVGAVGPNVQCTGHNALLAAEAHSGVWQRFLADPGIRLTGGGP